MDIAKYAKKLDELKKKSVRISVENRKLKDEETRKLTISRKPKVYKMANEELEEPIDDQQDQEHEKKLLNYKIKEYEEWELVQKRRKIEENGDNVNLQELAKYTYDKQLKRQRINTKLEETKLGVRKIHKNASTGKYIIKDDDRLVRNLANESKKVATERYLARGREMARKSGNNGTGGYINDKNKQFNEKLTRQLGKEK